MPTKFSSIVRSFSDNIKRQSTNMLQNAASNLFSKTAGPMLDSFLNNVLPGEGGSISRSSSSNPNSWMERARNRPDPHLNIDWDVQLPYGLDSAYAEEATLAYPTLTSSEGIFRQASHVFFAEIQEVQAFSITFYEDRLFTVTNWANSWMAQVRNADGSYNMPGNGRGGTGYKRPITFYPTDVKGRRIAALLATGCWPTNMGSLELGSGQAARTLVRVEFSVDDLQIQINNTPSPALSGVMPIESASGGINLGLGKVVDTLASEGIRTAKDFLTKTASSVAGNIFKLRF